MTPISGSISLSQVRAELGITGAISFNDLDVRRAVGSTSSTTLSMSDLRGCQRLTSEHGVQRYLTDYAPGGTYARTYNFYIPSTTFRSGAVAGWSILTGAWPAGSTIAIRNYGRIWGARGAPGTAGTGGHGGSCIYAADAIGCTVNVYNHSGAEILGGGGGGGRGGTGGTGGTGFYYWNNVQYNLSTGYYWVYSSCNNTCYAYWNNALMFTAPGNPASGNGYYRENLIGTSPCGKGGTNYYYRIYRSEIAYTSGGAGGVGGSGGYGSGYPAGYTSGLAGSAGAAGGLNAGSGGTGGTGGTGGDFGVNGATGGTGATGNPGNAAAGTAGNPGSAGGGRGYYFYKGGSVAGTFTNYSGGSYAGNTG